MRGTVHRAPLRRVRRGLVRALEFLLAPGVAWLRDGRTDRRFAIAVAARDGGCVLLAPTARPHTGAGRHVALRAPPFFYDPGYLATHAPPALPHLRYAFLDGAFDAELVALFGAVGLVFDSAPATRRSLAGMVLLLRAVREAGLLGGDRRRYEAEVAAGAPSERHGAASESFLAVAARNWRTSILTER